MQRIRSILPILAILGALTAILFASPARAQNAVVGTPFSVCIAEVHPGDTPVSMFSSLARFDCATPQTRFGPGDYWAVSPSLAGIPNLGQRDRVRTASLWQDAVTLYALYPDGRIVAQTYDGHAATRHLQLGAIFEWKLPEMGTPPVRLMWHVHKSANLRGIVLAPRLATAAQSANANLSMAAIYAGFVGFCFALLIYNLAMWTALRHRFQLAYCAMVASLLVYTLTSSGTLAWMNPVMLNNDRLRINYILLTSAAITALMFGRTFFPRAVTAGWVGRMVDIVATLLSIATIAFALFAPWHIRLFDSLYSLSFAGVMLVVVPIVVRAWREPNPQFGLFAAAWAAPVLFAVLRLLGNLALVPWSFWLDNSTILSMSFEAIISTMAIAYRIRRLSVERDEAIEREIIAARLADTDPLTGLLNRRAFLRQAIGSEGEQMLLLTDLDHFKHVNETLGHDGGDEVLRIFARTLRQVAPTTALVARMGGEEFAMLMPADHAIAPDLILTKLRTARMPFDLSVTASIGACAGPTTSEPDWKAMYRRADRALFDAKQAGRDRARFASSFAA